MDTESLLADALSSLLRAVLTFPPDTADAQRAYRYPVKEARHALNRYHDRDTDDPTEADTDLELQSA